MVDFTINSLDYTQNPGPGGFVSNYDEFVDWHDYLEEDFVWWCLGHNFDVIGAILSMAHISWQQGFNSGETLRHFFDDREAIADLAYDRDPQAAHN